LKISCTLSILDATVINGGIKMLFQTKDFYVDIIDNKYSNKIVEIYNSNEK